MSKVKKYIFGFIIANFLICQNTFGLQKESAHFIFNFEAADSSVIDTIESKLEGSFIRITKDLQLTVTTKTSVYIYPNLQAFHNAIGNPGAPDWLVGIGTQAIYAVSPLNPGPAHTYKDMVNSVFIHEFTHVCVAKINSFLPVWLNEGFACYEGGPYYSKESIVTSYKKLQRIPDLDELNNFSSFSKMGGYPFSLTIAYFIIESFSIDAMRSFIHQPENYQVFSGLNKNEFQDKWHQYVKEKYLDLSNTKVNNTELNFKLDQNYPNPFNSTTVIRYNLPVEEEIELTIHNTLGEKIHTLAKTIATAGEHIIRWDGLDEPGHLCAGGVYVYSLKTNGSYLSRKMVLLK